MTSFVPSADFTRDDVALYWICWEDGYPQKLLLGDQAEHWLRRGDYMHRSISPLSMQSDNSIINLLADLGYSVEL